MSSKTNKRNIYEELKNKAIKIKRLRNKDFILIYKKDFNRYRPYFKKIKNLFNGYNNYRYGFDSRHIHVIESKNLVEFHYDAGNFEKNPFIGRFMHLFIDVIPYFIYCIFKLQKPLPYKINKI